MFHKTKAYAVALGAATLLPITVAAPVAAMSPCQARPVPARTTGYSQVVVIAGAYTSAGATDVSLTCGVVRNGVTYARQSAAVRGPVVALAGVANLSIGPVTSCYELRVVYSDGRVTYGDTCP